MSDRNYLTSDCALILILFIQCVQNLNLQLGAVVCFVVIHSLLWMRFVKDTIERVFHEMGIGRPRNLHEFYQNRIVKYHEHLLHVYQKLQDAYSQLLNQINNGSG